MSAVQIILGSKLTIAAFALVAEVTLLIGPVLFTYLSSENFGFTV